jgi:membrane peptidoglycan carboxypeptidase
MRGSAATDWGAVATAWDRYQSAHGRVLGASTISMQTAKNVFLRAKMPLFCSASI